MDFPDVNVLVHAFRRDSAGHAPCRMWLNAVVDARRPLALSTQVLASVVRITTNRRAFTNPSSLEDAIGFCDDLLDYPHREVIEPSLNHWRIFSDLLKDTDTIGPMITDAWFAALAMEWNCEFVTLDRDFARFPGLRWRNPGV